MAIKAVSATDPPPSHSLYLTILVATRVGV